MGVTGGWPSLRVSYPRLWTKVPLVLLVLGSNFHFSSISRSSNGFFCLCFKDLCLRIPACVPQHHPHRPCKTFLGLTPPPSLLENKAEKMQSYPQTSLNFTKLKKLSFNSFQSSDFVTV